jgi:hypothetical protein
MRAFGSCANAPPAALWYDKQFPPFINYDQDSTCPCFILFLFVCLTLFFLVAIYDAHSNPFLFSKEDFVRLPSLPRYKKYGDPKHADLPPNALVTVFFTLNTYVSSRAPPTPSMARNYDDRQAPFASGSSRRDDPITDSSSPYILSPNLQFLLYHGLIPDDD